MIPSKYRKFAKAFYFISHKDINRAKRALGEKDYPLCLFYAQQSVEKHLKLGLRLN
ncbi:HEPN domain-containing protein [Sulfolobus tengchongensis]|uniref:HEPN domain-containing protein n=1 Tax=Sulfolobus tengchongensis TaxID=207809 RepID=A0AAX4KZ95_9CREN